MLRCHKFCPLEKHKRSQEKAKITQFSYWVIQAIFQTKIPSRWPYRTLLPWRTWDTTNQVKSEVRWQNITTVMGQWNSFDMLKTENGRQEPTSSFFTSLLSLYLQVSPNSTKIQCKRCLQKGKKMYTIFAYIYCILLPLSHYYVCSNLEKDALHSPYVSLL